MVNERYTMESDILRGRLMVEGMKPDMAHLADVCGEYLVVFDYPLPHTKHVRTGRTIVKFRNKKIRDDWWYLFQSGFAIK